MTQPLMTNASDPKQVRKADVKKKDEERQELDDVKQLLNSPHGRRFVWRYLGICGVFRSSFTGNSETFFNEGQRNIGLQLLGDVNRANPEAYVTMLREHERA